MHEAALIVTDDGMTAGPETFAEARAQCLSTVFAFVSRRVKPIEEAEDVVADVFVEAFSCWRKRKGPPKLWLFGIARRKIVDHYRKRKVAQLIARDAGPTGNLLAEFEDAAMFEQAMSILGSLPADERDALTMQVLEELSIMEISIVMGRSYAATNSLLQRARQRVQAQTSKPMSRGENQ